MICHARRERLQPRATQKAPQPPPTPQPKLGSDVDDRLALTQLRRRRPAVPSGVDQNHKLVGAAPGPPHGHRHLLDRGKPEKRRLLPAAMAYQATLSPGLYGFCQESDSLKYELNAAVFLASIGIIVLLLNGRLPTRGIRCYAVWACVTIAFVGLIGAFAAGCYSWKVSVVDVLLLVLAVIACISLQILGVEDDDLGPVPEDGEQEVGITGERTEEAPLGVLEISTPIIGSAFTVILGIPVMATVDFLVKLPVAILIVSILVSIWQRSFARLLGALARPLRRRCIIPNHGAASSTPREQLVSSLCHGACKVIDSLRSGEWMLVVVLVIWKPELRQNLKVRFKVSKISAVLGFQLVSAVPMTTASGSTMIGTPATATTTASSGSATTTATPRRRRDRPLVQVEVEPRPARNRRPNSQVIGGVWNNS